MIHCSSCNEWVQPAPSISNFEQGHKSNCNKEKRQQKEDDEYWAKKRREDERYERMFPYD